MIDICLPQPNEQQEKAGSVMFLCCCSKKVSFYYVSQFLYDSLLGKYHIVVLSEYSAQFFLWCATSIYKVNYQHDNSPCHSEVHISDPAHQQPYQLPATRQVGMSRYRGDIKKMLPMYSRIPVCPQGSAQQYQ